MNYKVLYRKYRPDDFENIIGQDYITKTLKNSIINQNISHAYIFSGPRGTGKTSTAKVFAKTINCLNNDSGIPCNECEFCTNFNENPDIIEIDAASNNGVDEIRNLIDNIKLTPTNGKYKVYIIDEVHMLTTSAFNALLLTLEEPPKHAVFILATTNIENVPITILSRCQRYDFQKIKIEDIVKRLENICEKEKIEVDVDALTEIAYISDGGMRDALSLLDQLSKNNQKITLELVEQQIKIVSQKMLKNLFDLIEKNNINEFIKTITEFKLKSVDYKTLIKKLIELASIKAKNIKITRKYDRLDFDDYKQIVLNLTESLNRININVDPYTILEMELLEFFDVTMEQKQTNNEQKFEKVKDVIEISEKSPKKETNVCEKIYLRINNCFVNAKKSYLEEMKKLLEKYQNSDNIIGKLKSIILDSQVVASSDKYAIMVCDNENIMNSANKVLDQLEKDIKNNCNKDIKLIFITNSQWLLEKQKYIENLQNGIKYTFIEENTEEEMLEICDIFDRSKVEII